MYLRIIKFFSVFVFYKLLKFLLLFYFIYRKYLKNIRIKEFKKYILLVIIMKNIFNNIKYKN